MDKLRFQCFGTGSSGNCYYIGNIQYGVLIDAGVSSREVRKYLKISGLDFSNLRGIFITHDHADHIRSVVTLGEKFLIPVYATAEIHEGIKKNYCVTEDLQRSRRTFQKNETIEMGDLKITSFPVSHDSTDSVGYTVEYLGKRITFATDLGFVGTEAAEHLLKANYVIVETNYDEQMLENGKYSRILKRRINSATGHLSNRQTAEFLAENMTEKWKHIFLCHISAENNLPELAFNTVKEHLEKKNIIVGKDVQLTVLERLTPSEMYVL